MGPHDPSDRFTYWPRTIARGGEVLVPDCAQRPIQFVDVRDLVAWTMSMLERSATGTCHVAGPEEPYTWPAFLERCRTAVGTPEATFVPVAEEFLREEEVGYWMDLPLWVPEEMEGMLAIDVSRAIAEGMSFRPLEETARDTLAWDGTRPEDVEYKAGISQERHVALLERWHAGQRGAWGG